MALIDESNLDLLTQYEFVKLEIYKFPMYYFKLEDKDDCEWYLVVHCSNAEIETYIIYMKDKEVKYPKLKIDFILTIDDLISFMDKFYGTYYPNE